MDESSFIIHHHLVITRLLYGVPVRVVGSPEVCQQWDPARLQHAEVDVQLVLTAAVNDLKVRGQFYKIFPQVLDFPTDPPNAQ